MPPLRHMNGQPIRFSVVTDLGVSGRREVYSSHLTVGGARRAIYKMTGTGYGYRVPPWSWWVAEIDPDAAEYRDIKILAYWPEGPYADDNRPPRDARLIP